MVKALFVFARLRFYAYKEFRMAVSHVYWLHNPRKGVFQRSTVVGARSLRTKLLQRTLKKYGNTSALFLLISVTTLELITQTVTTSLLIFHFVNCITSTKLHAHRMGRRRLWNGYTVGNSMNTSTCPSEGTHDCFTAVCTPITTPSTCSHTPPPSLTCSHSTHPTCSVPLLPAHTLPPPSLAHTLPLLLVHYPSYLLTHSPSLHPPSSLPHLLALFSHLHLLPSSLPAQKVILAKPAIPWRLSWRARKTLTQFVAFKGSGIFTS